MRPVLLSAFILYLMLGSTIALASGEVRDRQEVYPDKTYSMYKVPADPYERAKVLHEIARKAGGGEGTYFRFNTLFTPSSPEQTSLRPGLVLNTRVSPPYRLQGSCAIRDPYGLRIRQQGQKLMNNQTYDITMIFAGGNRVYQWYSTDSNPYEEVVEGNYLGFDAKGAKFFMDSIFMRGVVSGPRMENLLEVTNATRIGMETIKGTRAIVYGVQPTRQDYVNGYRYLQVWVRVGDYKIVRTSLDMLHGKEFTEYSNILTNLEFNPDEEKGFLLPGETIQQMVKETDMILYPEKYHAHQDNNPNQTQEPVVNEAEGAETPEGSDNN